MSRDKKYPVRKRLRLKGFDYTSSGFYFVTIDCKNMEYRFGNILKGKMLLNDFGNIAISEWLELPFRFVNIRLHQFQIMPNHFHGIVEIVEISNSEENKEMIKARGETSFSENFPKKKNNSVESFSQPASTVEDSIRAGDSTVGDFTRAGASPAHTGISLDRCVVLQEKNPEDHCHKSLSEIIGSYKSIVNNACLALHKEKYRDAYCIPYLGKIWHRSFYDTIIPDSSCLKSVSRYIRNNPKKWNRQ